MSYIGVQYSFSQRKSCLSIKVNIRANIYKNDMRKNDLSNWNQVLIYKWIVKKNGIFQNGLYALESNKYVVV